MRARTPQEFADAVARQVLWMQTIAVRRQAESERMGLRDDTARNRGRYEAFKEVLDLIDSEISSEPIPTPRPIGA